MILDAVRAIGPALSQNFYRALVGDKEAEARMEAAARLSERPRGGGAISYTV